MNLFRIASVALISLLLGACQNMQNNPKQTGGTIIGAGLGALIGAQLGGGKGRLAAVALGTLAGAYFGGEVGKSLDKADRLYAERSAQNSLEYNKSGQISTWQNPDSGNSGTFTPSDTYKTTTGGDCRKFETTVKIGGRNETATGRACRQPDGTWKIVR